MYLLSTRSVSQPRGVTGNCLKDLPPDWRKNRRDTVYCDQGKRMSSLEDGLKNSLYNYDANMLLKWISGGSPQGGQDQEKLGHRDQKNGGSNSYRSNGQNTTEVVRIFVYDTHIPKIVYEW